MDSQLIILGIPTATLPLMYLPSLLLAHLGQRRGLPILLQAHLGQRQGQDTCSSNHYHRALPPGVPNWGRSHPRDILCQQDILLLRERGGCLCLVDHLVCHHRTRTCMLVTHHGCTQQHRPLRHHSSLTLLVRTSGGRAVRTASTLLPKGHIMGPFSSLSS